VDAQEQIMTQFQHTLKALLEGRKTETSRIALPQPDGTGEFDCEMIGYPLGVPSVQRYLVGWDKWRTVWQTGKDYAIVPARGKKSVGRFVVDAIWWQDVRSLTAKQIQAEGFNSAQAFDALWLKMHGEHYEAWRMTIRVLWETVDWDAPAVVALQIKSK
jgi:hypothetical protein